MAFPHPTPAVRVSDLTPEQKTTLERYRNWLLARKGVAANTADNYCGALRRASVHLGMEPNDQDIDNFLGGLYSAKVSYSHLVMSIVAIERYQEFRGIPCKLGRPTKPEGLIGETLTEAEVSVLISTCKDIRIKTLLALLAYSGIRNQEMTRLRVADIDFSSGHVRVLFGKGKRSYNACIAGDCVKLLNQYIRDCNIDPAGLLFTTVRHGSPLDPQDIRKIVRTAVKNAGITKRVHPHTFRHSLAMAMLNRGAGLMTIRDQLGHVFIQTTMLYLKSEYTRRKSDYNLCVPSYL